MLSRLGNNTTKDITKSLMERLLGKKKSDSDSDSDSDSTIPISLVVAHEMLANLDPLSIASLAKDLWPRILDCCLPSERISLRIAMASSGKTIFDNYVASNEERLYTIVPSLLERIEKEIDAETLQLVEEKTRCMSSCTNLIGWTICISVLLYIICATILLAEYLKQQRYSNLVEGAAIGAGSLALFCVCIVCPIVASINGKIDAKYNEFELYLMSSPNDEKNCITTYLFWKEVYLYTGEQGPYIRTPIGRMPNSKKSVLLPIHLEPTLFNQPSTNPEKCTDREICREVFEVLEKTGLKYARSHILNRPISTLSPVEEKQENGTAYNKIFKSFPPQTTMRNMMFDIRKKFLGYIQNNNALKQECSEESKKISAPFFVSYG